MIPGTFKNIYDICKAGWLYEQILTLEPTYADPDDPNLRLKINTEKVMRNLREECYRELMVSYIPMMALFYYPQVSISEADYILYMSPYARADDISDKAIAEIKEIAAQRKPGAKIVVVGKAANCEKLLNGSISDIIFYGDHYAEKVGKLFDIDFGEQYFIYDDKEDHLAFWPVDGCMNKCKFCRRSYMDIKFESIPLDVIKENLDRFKANHPEQMRRISLRAENITEYGIDIYGKQMLHHIINMLDSYDEIESIDIMIGLSIGEVTDEILDAIVKSRKIRHIQMNPEVGTDRLLNVIGKRHTREKAIRVFKAIRKAHPDAFLSSTVMIGLPTETNEDILALASLMGELDIDYLHVNNFVVAPRQPLAKYPQLSAEETEAHLRLLIQELPQYLNRDLVVDHNKIFDDKDSPETKQAMEELEKLNKECLFPRHYIEYRRWDNKTKEWLVDEK